MTPVPNLSTFPDLPDAFNLPSPGSATTGRRSPTGDRRETILSLVEMLLAQNERENAVGKNPSPSFEDDKDVPTVDEHPQVAGAEVFHKLQKRMNSLDKELRNSANAARQLGSSVAILSSAFYLRERLAQLMFLYHENAANLFPRKVSHIARETPGESPTSSRRKWGIRRPTGKARLHIPRPTVSENLDPECFPEQLEGFAKEVTNFLRCLNEFPEFTDEAVNASILGFEGDLQYWASCLREYEGQFRYPAVQRYIHDLSTDIGEHVEELASSLSMFIEVGVPTIRFAQEHGAANLLNLSTVATFFSAVTATTLQFSYGLDRGSISDSVNILWFASMVFSIAAAVNSLLGLTWKQAMYRSPGHRVPWWVLIWIKRSPLVFLVLSVACFSIGLCCFAYASNQAPVTSTITTVLTAFTSFGLAAVSAWFASERWAFARHRGQKWLDDVLEEIFATFLALRAVSWMHKLLKAGCRHLASSLRSFGRSVKRAYGSCFACSRRDDGDDSDPESGGLPRTISDITDPENEKPFVSRSRRRASDATVVTRMSDVPPLSPIFQQPPTPVSSPVDKEFPPSSGGAAAALAAAVNFNGSGIAFPQPSSPPSHGKILWRNALRNVKMRNAMLATEAISGTPLTTPPIPSSSATPVDSPRPSSVTIAASATSGHGGGGRSEPIRKRTTSSGVGAASIINRRQTLPGERVGHVGSRLSTLMEKLIDLEATHDLAAHAALVRHMQFSPDGRFLATSSWDKTSVIFRVGHPFTPHRVLAHAQGFVGQVAWSPNGKLLLTKMPRGVKVWTAEEGVCKKTIMRNTSIEAITWCPNGEAFLSIEDSIVTKLDLSGKEIDRYEFANMKIHDVAVTPDGVRMLGVGPLLRSPTGLQPSKSRGEKRIFVYNMETKQIESQTPVLEDVKDITVAQTSKNGLVALVSYEHKAPPQLWKLELVKDRGGTEIVNSKFLLRHTYMTKTPVDFAGPSYFGGKNNELVLCCGKAGDIHIWDTESGALVHSIRAQAHGGDLTCIAWNHATEDPYMFAAGSHDGAVRVWTQLPEEPEPEVSILHAGGEPTPTNHIMSDYISGAFPRSTSPYPMGSHMSSSSLSLDDHQSLTRASLHSQEKERERRLGKSYFAENHS
ncbi:hypothetical protein CPB83DRAFT_851296 [Crepidotus variabilis]|uniref:WD40 repeat-like protein n=1 Tax=Crepidotus variabilis TaxID=179855 RepID=A0A9P6EJW2_9AGAR|nr:hypothetical protein CPB83DRAFT_851296 [Crepidotus variabilis]